MHLSRSILAALAGALVATAAHAQQWAGPFFSSPLAKPKWDLIVSDAYGAGGGVTAAVRPFASAPGLRLRLGIADGQGSGPLERGVLYSREELALMAGIDYAAPLAAGAEGRLRADWVAGLGFAMNGGSTVSVPLGISIGYEGDHIRPYVTPRVVLEHRAGVARPWTGPGTYVEDDGFRTGAVVDWGVDVPLGDRGLMRLALTTGSWKGIGLGFSF